MQCIADSFGTVLEGKNVHLFETTPHIYFRGHMVVYGKGAGLAASLGFYQTE
jgi:hypothetical protein